jgi:hypothetical protein
MSATGRQPRRPATNSITGENDTPSSGRCRPELVIRVPLESHGRVYWHSHTLQDQERLLVWLRCSSTLSMLRDYLAGLEAFLEEEAA